jgi:hypothetical protein
MSAEYEIVKYRPELKPLVVELQKELWSSDAGLNTRFLEWKYEQNPQLREPLIYLALHQGQPVGMRGFHAARLEAGTPSRAFPVLVAGDALVSAAHRNRGLVTRIMKLADADLADRDYRYLVSIGGANRLNTFGLLTLGWRSTGGLRPMGRVRTQARRRRTLNRRVAGLPWLWRFRDARFLASAAQRRPFRRLDAVRPGRGPGRENPIAVERRPRIDAMVELVERLGHDGRVRYVRDREYLTWRFQNPLSDHRFLYWEEGRLEGYLVLNRRPSDLGAWDRVYIADLEASSMRIRSELLTSAIALGRFPELVTWTATLSEDQQRLLVSQGFEPVDPEDTARGCPCILMRPLRGSPPDTEWALGGRRLLDIASWDIRVLYSMRG